MVSLAALWLPLLLSRVIVFIASSIMHMILPYHRSDYGQLPDEDKLLPVIGAAGLQRGSTIFPYATHKDMKSQATAEKYDLGPVGMMTVFPSGLAFTPKFLGLWFAYTLIIRFFVAYLTGHTIAPGPNYPAVFRVAGTAGFMVYGLGLLSKGIWKGQPWSTVLEEVFDGLTYGLLTAGIFGWLWPR